MLKTFNFYFQNVGFKKAIAYLCIFADVFLVIAAITGYAEIFDAVLAYIGIYAMVTLNAHTSSVRA